MDLQSGEDGPAVEVLAVVLEPSTARGGVVRGVSSEGEGNQVSPRPADVGGGSEIRNGA